MDYNSVWEKVKIQFQYSYGLNLLGDYFKDQNLNGNKNFSLGFLFEINKIFKMN